MHLMDAALENALAIHAANCIQLADEVARLRHRGSADSDDVLRLLERHLRQDSAITTMRMTEGMVIQPSPPPAPPPPRALWRRIVRRVGLWLASV